MYSTAAHYAVLQQMVHGRALTAEIQGRKLMLSFIRAVLILAPFLVLSVCLFHALYTLP